MFADVEALEERLSRPTADLEGWANGLHGPLVVLGAGGKMGPTLARMARRAGVDRVVAVSRFSDPATRAGLEAHGVQCVAADLTDAEAVRALPDAAAVVFLAGRKFGTGGTPHATWVDNAWLPGLCADRYRGVPTVVLSSGNVYPFARVGGPWADESTQVAPVGEYAWSVLARERMFEHAAATGGTPVTIVRLNYATDLRYGVPVDVAQRVRDGAPIDLSTGHANVIWQGDANRYALRALALAASPPAVLNVTGPELVSIRALAARFGTAFGAAPRLCGTEAATALLADARRAHELFGAPVVALEELVDWTADWIAARRPTLDKPTRYEVRDGRY